MSQAAPGYVLRVPDAADALVALEHGDVVVARAAQHRRRADAGEASSDDRDRREELTSGPSHRRARAARASRCGTRRAGRAARRAARSPAGARSGRRSSPRRRGTACPSGPRRERRQRDLERGDQPADQLGLALPGEVDADACPARAAGSATGGRRRPCGSRLIWSAGRIASPSPRTRLDGGEGVRARDEVLGLDLLARARREAHLEVRQAVRPAAGDALLAGAVDRDRSQGSDAARRSRDARRTARRGGCVGARLHPHRADVVVPAA